MNICKEKIYENKTFLYLYPALKYLGEDFISKINSLFKLAIGIDDYNKHYENCIYILLSTKNVFSINAKHYQENLQNFLDFIKYKSYYVDDYVFQIDKYNFGHIVVIKFPKIIAYEHFKTGMYSKMYKKEEIDFLFKTKIPNNKEDINKNKRVNKIKSILTLDKSLFKERINEINKDWNLNLSIEHFDTNTLQLDYPPKWSEEIFNYKKSEDDFWHSNL